MHYGINYFIYSQAKSFDSLWAEGARRAALRKIMEQWVTEDNKEQTVNKLLTALREDFS